MVNTKLVNEVFGKLSYGPNPESSGIVDAWLKAHEGKFGLFIDNKWSHPENRSYLASVSPSTTQKLAETINATSEDIDLAVASSKAAFPAWSSLTGFERAKHLYSIARHIQKHARLLSVLESMDNGKPFRESKTFDVPTVVRHFYHHAGWAQSRDEELPGYSPVGVVGAIVPWNFPLMLLAWKVAPALAMGNTVVLKPASNTRLSALLFAEICAEAGLPPGVLNVVTGSGSIGSVLAAHADVDKVAFTGSTPVGMDLRRLTAGTGKKISLELGGKSPIVVLNSADMHSVVEGIISAIFFNQGQVCCAGSRLLVQESAAKPLVDALKRRLGSFRVGPSLDKSIDMGALVDQKQLTSVDEFVKEAEAMGADVWQATLPENLKGKGFYYPPTIISNVAPTFPCVREEIFGPVITVQTFRSQEEAIELANNTRFGLGASVWSENVSASMDLALKIKAGTVWVNCHNVMDAAAGFGGFKESGFGRDGGKEGLYEYVKLSHVKRVALDSSIVVPSWPSAPISASLPILPSANKPSLAINRTAKMYIGGAQVRPDGEVCTSITSPDGTLLGNVPEGNRKDIRNAVEKALAASTSWGARSGHNRAQILYYIAENLLARAEEFSERIASQTGRSKESCDREVQLSAERLFYYAGYADKYGGLVKETTLVGVTVSVYEPIGVLGVVCPEEFPLLGLISVLAPTIVRGNTIVLIPSYTAPLCATDLYQVLDTSDLPAGVVNIVTGHQESLVKTLAEHQAIDGVWYFGTAQGSANVEYASAKTVKRTWCNYGQALDWESKEQGQGLEFLRRSVEVKHIWIPIGDGKA